MSVDLSSLVDDGRVVDVSFFLRVIADESSFFFRLVSSFSRSAYWKHWSTKFFPVKNDEEGPICDYCR